ncbi:MAG: sulfurtransferase [Rhodocyclaceae bacterium]|nr:sulfurtransferase [Rhodocyclaceae bacterium]
MSPDFTTLITPQQLFARLGAPDWVVVDCRHDLAQPDFGRAAYLKGHLPGAHFLHLDDDLSGPKTGVNGRHPLPDPQRLAARLGELGIDANTQVVAYDDTGGMYAARLWWLLNWLGHRKVAVLDGGFRAWCSTLQVLDRDAPVASPRSFIPTLQALAVDVDHVRAHCRSDAMTLIDARSPDRYRGENETIDPVGGHIPGAINRFFKDNLGPDGCFKAADQLRREFDTLLAGRDPERVVNQCGSGVTACHNLLAMQIAGLPGAKLYPGSWSEWCADPARPVARGA